MIRGYAVDTPVVLAVLPDWRFLRLQPARGRAMISTMKAAGHTRHASSVSYGAALTFETLIEGDGAPTRMHVQEDTLLRVVAGLVRLTIEADERMLATGEEAIVPAGAPHRIVSASAEARILIGLR
jgi:mannose-6-phosphate isomerase-like protein (cupin superfamily)